MNLNFLFIVGAIVLIVLAIIGTASSSAQALGVNWDTWASASLLSFFASIAVNRLDWPKPKT